MKKMENIIFSAKQVLISELDDFKLKVKFVICDFETNGNNVKINRKNIDTWLSTLVNQPLVGKVEIINNNGEMDFTGHNVKIIKSIDENGYESYDYEFDTSAFGTFTDVGIEEIDGVECITATATVWRRFKNASDVLISRVENGTLHSSWELATLEYEDIIENGRVVKLINKGEFLANCVLGDKVAPAYSSAKVLQVAESNNDNEITDAIVNDIMVANKDGENLKKTENKDVVQSNDTTKVEETEIVAEETVDETVEEVVETEIEKSNEETIKDESEVEVSALTSSDILKELERLTYEKSSVYPIYVFPEEKTVYARIWSMKETEFLKFTYEVENDKVVISEPTEVNMTFSAIDADVKVTEVEEKLNTSTEALLKANDKIKELEMVVSELTPYKEKFVAQEQERITREQEQKRAELSEYALKSKLITSEELDSNEDIKVMIEKIDEKGIKSIIAERLIAKIESNSKKEVEVETSSKELSEKVNLDSVMSNNANGFSLKDYLNK